MKYGVTFSFKKGGKRHRASAGGKDYVFKTKSDAKGFIKNPIIREGKYNPRIIKLKKVM